jgi:ubiquinone/menaquinone biosynthesis C-methylase UbiE
MSARGATQFRELAEYYDPLNDAKDYQAEAARLEALARRFGAPQDPTWLDVACGTGRHLEFLRRRHTVVGIDLSPEMLRIARRRLPGVRLVRGDMRSVELGRSFDVVSCLFSAIGHLPTKRDVRRAFSNFARHLNPGGVVIVEPWIDPAIFHSGFLHLVTFRSPKLTLARLSSSARRGSRSIVRFHYLVGKPDARIRYVEVEDKGLLLSREELLSLMRDAGLRPHWIAKGFTLGRGLLIGVKPRVRSAR